MGSLLTNVSTAFGNKLRDQSHDSAFQGGVSRENRMRMRSRFNNYGQGEYASDEEISRAIVSEENETTPPAAPSGSTSVIARIAGMILGNNDENMDSLERAGGPSPRMRLSMDANYARAQRDATSAEELEQMPTADNNYNFDQAFDQLPVDPAFDLMDSTPESDANFQRILDRMDAAPDLLAATATPVTSAIPTGSNLLQQGLELEGIDDPVFKELARSIFHQETSGGTNVRRSSAGAIGPMQILPGTFNEVADPGMDINNPLDNMRAGIRYLLKGYKAAGRDPMGAAAFYYGGGGGLQSLSDPSRDPRPGSGGPTVSEYASQVVNRMQAQARGYGIERLDMGISSSVVPSLQPNQVSQLSQDLNRRSQVAVIQPIINNIVNNNNNSTNTSVANSRSGSSGAGRSYNIDRTLMNIVNNRTLSPA
jgi:soluble lytic murein transglycosylase-like protein